MYITFHDIISFLIYTLAISVGILLTIVLINTIRFTNCLNNIISENTENINETLKSLPRIAKNIDDISLTTNETLDKVKNTVELFETIAEVSAETISKNSGGFIRFINILNTIFTTMMDFIFAFKKN